MARAAGEWDGADRRPADELERDAERSLEGEVAGPRDGDANRFGRRGVHPDRDRGGGTQAIRTGDRARRREARRWWRWCIWRKCRGTVGTRSIRPALSGPSYGPDTLAK